MGTGHGGKVRLDAALIERLLAEHRRESDAAFDALPLRPAAHAGAAYPEDADEARAFLDALLDGAPDPPPETPPPARLIAPHIDLRLGGAIHGAAQKALRAGPRPDLVVVLGVCHEWTDRVAIACRKDFATPLGTLRVDQAFLDRLEDGWGASLTADHHLHRDEHSVEFQALWLAHAWPADPPALAPLLVGSFGGFLHEGRSPASDPAVEGFASALRAVLARTPGRTVVVASVDLAHVGPAYDHARGLDERGEAELERADRALLVHAERGDAEAFFRELAREENARQVCGTAPIWMTLRLGGGPGRLLAYGQGRIDPPTRSVVSYAALAYPA